MRLLGRIVLHAPLLLVCLAGGCSYEYDIVQPAALAQHIGTDRDVVVRMDPVEYRLRSFDSRLVMIIQNGDSAPVQLIGERSYLVDPEGQSHPLPSFAIAPESYAKLILPPFRPVGEPGPVIGIAIGGGFGRIAFERRGGPARFDRWWYGDRGGYVYEPGRVYEPGYVVADYPSDPYYWEWDGETDVRLELVFVGQRGEFHGDFVFHRRKA